MIGIIITVYCIIIILCIFLEHKPNDWILVWSTNKEYTYWYEDKLGLKTDKQLGVTFYNIYFSKYRNKYKLKKEGYDCNSDNSNEYIKALQQLALLNNTKI